MTDNETSPAVPIVAGVVVLAGLLLWWLQPSTSLEQGPAARAAAAEASLEPEAATVPLAPVPDPEPAPQAPTAVPEPSPATEEDLPAVDHPGYGHISNEAGILDNSRFPTLEDCQKAENDTRTCIALQEERWCFVARFGGRHFVRCKTDRAGCQEAADQDGPITLESDCELQPIGEAFHLIARIRPTQGGPAAR